jgi:hypothetical protein
MLDKLMKLYVMAMAYDVRSPMPHIVGPPGCGKSTNVERLAEILDVNLHLVNVSRLSPLDVEGVQMPHGTGEEMILRMLPATYWSSLEEGDIILFDEFLRGFPEVYSALLDIFTSRRVGNLRLPKVFMIGASNSVVAYDAALEDRLLHIPVTDPRKRKSEKDKLARILVEELGLLPQMATCAEMQQLLDHEVLPMFDLLDSFDRKGTKVTKQTNRAGGTSLRNLIGQAQLRLVKSTYLKDLIESNNHVAIRDGKAQYVLLLKADSKTADLPAYRTAANKLKGNPRLTPVQSLNLSMNLQLIELQQAMKEEDDE